MDFIEEINILPELMYSSINLFYNPIDKIFQKLFNN